MAKLLNEITTEKIYDESELINEVFFEGDYLAHQTASGKEEIGIRLRHDIHKTLSKEKVRELFDLVIKGLVTQEKFFDARDN